MYQELLNALGKPVEITTWNPHRSFQGFLELVTHQIVRVKQFADNGNFRGTAVIPTEIISLVEYDDPVVHQRALLFQEAYTDLMDEATQQTSQEGP